MVNKGTHSNIIQPVLCCVSDRELVISIDLKLPAVVEIKDKPLDVIL